MDVTIHFRLDNADRDAIQKIADAESRTFSQTARMLLKEALAMRAGEYETEFNRG